MSIVGVPLHLPESSLQNQVRVAFDAKAPNLIVEDPPSNFKEIVRKTLAEIHLNQETLPLKTCCYNLKNVFYNARSWDFFKPFQLILIALATTIYFFGAFFFLFLSFSLSLFHTIVIKKIADFAGTTLFTNPVLLYSDATFYCYNEFIKNQSICIDDICSLLFKKRIEITFDYTPCENYTKQFSKALQGTSALSSDGSIYNVIALENVSKANAKFPKYTVIGKYFISTKDLIKGVLEKSLTGNNQLLHPLEDRVLTPLEYSALEEVIKNIFNISMDMFLKCWDIPDRASSQEIESITSQYYNKNGKLAQWAIIELKSLFTDLNNRDPKEWDEYLDQISPSFPYRSITINDLITQLSSFNLSLGTLKRTQAFFMLTGIDLISS